MINDTYFNKFPIINYGNNVVRNISERVSVLHSSLTNPDAFYSVSLQDQTRPDIVASKLYGDGYRDWMLWLNNNSIDPYYNWYLSSDEFMSMIIDKYGSMPFAIQQTQYWRTAWPDNANAGRIPTDFYNNNLPSGWQKYFQPVIDDATNSILYYQQGYYDWRVSSNELVSYTIESGGPFAIGNVVQFTVAGNNVVGQAQVLECNSSLLVVCHTANNVLGTPYGIQDMFNTSVTGVVSNANTLVTLIPNTEIVFWEPVTSYIVEEEANAYRRFISVIEPSQAMQISTVINQILKQ